MWLANNWKDYELLDCGRGEKLERWGDKILVRPDPQAIWNTPRTLREWKVNDGRYSRSSTGGGHWDKRSLPQHWSTPVFSRSRRPTGTLPRSRSPTPGGRSMC